MSEEAIQLAKEAKSLQHHLREALRTKDPWDREVDFQRKQLRRNYLRLLLIHPYAPEAKDAETHLWMQTSYSFISLYKQRISALDRAHNAPRQQQQPQQPRHGPVEYRRILQRFRQFLAEEEKFWIQLIVRIRRIFVLDDVQPVLTALGIVPDEPAVEDASAKRNHFQFPPEADMSAAAPHLVPSATQREGRMAILSKALVCLGDLERYKEQYNEAGGRPRAGHEDGPPAVVPGQKTGRGKRGGPSVASVVPVMPRMRNYDKAQQCYEKARLLLPHDGNPAHQMAILASYQKDVFGSLIHYYRALCVRSPYDPAAENLGTILSKALDQWRSRGAKREKERQKEEARGGPSMAPRLRVEAFKERLVVLHALWRLSPEEADAISPNIPQKVAEEFKSLISDRVLPIDIILKTIILAEGALWRHRMFRAGSLGNGNKKAASGPTPQTSAPVPPGDVESTICSHVLSMHRVLLEVGIVELAEAPEDAQEHDLAQRITATFRRMLPALRISGKWLRANLRYVVPPQQSPSAAVDVTPKSRGRYRRREKQPSTSSVDIPGVDEFWSAYMRFATALWRAFPVDRLPQLGNMLEEDVEVAGFLPLRKFVPNEVIKSRLAGASRDNPAGLSAKALSPQELVHPNEEQLMRIADILVDAQALAKDESTPLELSDNGFLLNGIGGRLPDLRMQRPQAISERPVIPVTPHRSPIFVPQPGYPFKADEIEDDNLTDITRTDDDPVRDAVQKALDGSDIGIDEEEEQEDEIVWQPSAPPPIPHNTIIASSITASPPQHPIGSPTMPARISPTRHIVSSSPTFGPRKSIDITPAAVSPPSTAFTAQDLLNNVLHLQAPKSESSRPIHARQSSMPQPMLFPGSTPAGSGGSIWSSNTSGRSSFHGAAGTTSHPSYRQPNHLQHSPPSYAPQSRPVLGMSQPTVPPTYSQLQQSQPLGHGHDGHHRSQSLSTSRSYLLPSQSQSQHLLHDPPPGSYPALTEETMVPFAAGDRLPSALATGFGYQTQPESSVYYQTSGYPDRGGLPYQYEPKLLLDPMSQYPPIRSMAPLWNNVG